ncbi:MAG: dipeptide epimerase [Anaerolineae bacterium]|nr:dipeptide epimerase [Anaerolineae bacterium]
MKIERIEIAPLNLIPQVALTVAYGSYPELEYVLIKLHTDSGIIGLGEASPDPAVTGETQASTIDALERLTPALIGRDPFDIEAIIREVERIAPDHPGAEAAIDMALYDLMGKQLNMPVHKLIGGKARSTVDLYPVVPMDAPPVMAAMARQFTEQGFRALKIKLGSDPEIDIERVKAITEAVGGDIVLRPDINQGWSDAETTIAAIERLAPYNIEYIEQPTAASDLDALAKVTAAVDLPIMADESCHRPADALEIVMRGAADILNIKLMKCGGIYRALQIAAIGEAAGVPCILGSMGESSIGSAAALHLMAARPSIIACELIGPLFLSGDPATGFEVDMSTGQAIIPEAPGLGVSLR